MKVEFCPAFNPITRDAVSDLDCNGINDRDELNYWQNYLHTLWNT